ncbi:MAG: hypothetical protein ACJ71N_11235 [Terriglobales bacterium]|jgi:hypothetical protein
MRNLISLITLLCFAAAMAAAQGSASPTSNPPAATDSAPAQTSPTSNSIPPPPQTQTTAPQTQVPQTDQPAPAPGTVLQPANVPETAQGNDVAKGTEIRAALDTPLSSKTSKVGDRFTATVAQDVKGVNGSVGVPAGSKLEGEVSEVEEGKALPQLRGKGRLNLRFTDIVLPNGMRAPVFLTLKNVTDTAGKQSSSTSTSNEGEVNSRTSGGTVAKDVGIGAGIGTVAGLIFGHALRGLAIGAIAGGGYVLATQGKDVEMPAKAGLILNTDSPINISGTAPSTSPTNP